MSKHPNPYHTNKVIGAGAGQSNRALIVNVQDPLKKGRCQIRVVGHMDDEQCIPDDRLPWVVVRNATSSPSLQTSTTTHGLLPGTMVTCESFGDGGQDWIITGALPNDRDDDNRSTHPATLGKGDTDNRVPTKDKSRGWESDPYKVKDTKTAKKIRDSFKRKSKRSEEPIKASHGADVPAHYGKRTTPKDPKGGTIGTFKFKGKDAQKFIKQTIQNKSAIIPNALSALENLKKVKGNPTSVDSIGAQNYKSIMMQISSWFKSNAGSENEKVLFDCEYLLSVAEDLLNEELLEARRICELLENGYVSTPEQNVISGEFDFPSSGSGPAGAVGADGATGPIGPTGPQGEQGPIGLTGATGPSGPSGPSGPKGEDGYQGVDGATGPSGPSGPSGPIGETGATGPTGPAGTGLSPQGEWDSLETYSVGDYITFNTRTFVSLVNSNTDNEPPDAEEDDVNWMWVPSGATGQTGATGPTGPSGPSGPSGPTGATGATGPTGPTGPSGPSGPSGPTGATGATGPSGPSGPSGPTGETGATGPTGPGLGQEALDALIISSNVSFSGTSTQLFDNYIKTSFRTVDYVISIKNNSANGFQSSKLLVMDFGSTTDAYITDYAVLTSNTNLGNFTANCNTTHVNVYFTPTVANCVINYTRINSGV